MITPGSKALCQHRDLQKEQATLIPEKTGLQMLDTYHSAAGCTPWFPVAAIAFSLKGRNNADILVSKILKIANYYRYV